MTQISGSFWQVAVRDGMCQLKDEDWLEKLDNPTKAAM